MRKLLCVVGPTASGKTALAVDLALRLGGEIVGCDSQQVYRGLDIGTAKPTLEELKGVKHHMLDVAAPHESYTAGRYAKEAGACIDDLFAANKLPIMCGGTGLYLRALSKGLAEIPECPRLNHGENAYEILMECDPEYANRLSPNDRQRIFRGLDVFVHTGKSISSFYADIPPQKYEAVCVGIRRPREELYVRINQRVDDMLTAGLVEETLSLLNAGVPPNSAALSAIGYRETVSHILEGVSLADTAELIKQNSRRYAKRQMTWFTNQESVHWLEGDSEIIFDSFTKFVDICGVLC